MLIGDASIPPNPEVKLLCLIFAGLFYFIGFWCHLTLFILWLKAPVKDGDVSFIFIIISDCLFSLLWLPASVVIVLNSLHLKAVGNIGCIVTSIWGYVTTFSALYSLFMCSYQRLLIIYCKPTWTFRKLLVCYILQVIISIIFFSLPLMAGDDFVLAPSGVTCNVNYNSPNPATKLSIFYLCFLGFCMILGLILIYGTIFLHFYLASKRIKELDLNGTYVSKEQREILLENIQMKNTLFRRIIVMVICNVITFSPYLSVSFYEVATGEIPSPAVDAFAFTVANTSVILDFIILIAINSTYKGLFWNYVYGISSYLRKDVKK